MAALSYWHDSERLEESFAERSTRPGFADYLTILNRGAATTATISFVGTAALASVIALGPGRTTVPLAGGGVDFGIVVAAAEPIVVQRAFYADRASPGCIPVRGATTVAGTG